MPPGLLGLHTPNGVIQQPPAQDAPLALTTKPRAPSAQPSKGAPYTPTSIADTSLPVNLSTGSSRTQPPAALSAVGALQSATPLAAPAPTEGGRARGSRKSKSPKALAAWKGNAQNHLAQSLVDLFQHGALPEGEPAASSKDSDDSGDDDDDEDDDLGDEEDEDEEDSDDSLSGEMFTPALQLHSCWCFSKDFSFTTYASIGPHRRDMFRFLTVLEAGWRM